MDEELKKKVSEIGEVVKSLPPSVQEKAFEMLLTRELGPVPKPVNGEIQESRAESVQGASEDVETSVQKRGGEDLIAADLHLKARKFLDKQGLSLDDLNELFYKEGEEIKPLFEDLKTTKGSESQIRLGLLAALRNAIQKGEFEFSGEDVRQQCEVRKTYDKNNFNANFRNNRRFFEKFENYDKTNPVIRLSEEGRNELAKVIKELR